MNSWLNQGRLRRPGRGLKSKRIRQQTIQKTASHTEFLTLPKAAIDRLITAWDAVAAHPSKLATLVAQAKAAESAHQQAVLELAEITGSVANDYLTVLNLLKVAQTHFHKHPNPAVCPLCESSEKAAGLAEEVNRRIQSQGAHSKLEAAKHTVATKAKAVETEKQRLADASNSALTDAATLATYSNSGELPQGVDCPNIPVPDDFTKWSPWIQVNQQKRTAWQDASNACVADKKFIDTLRTSLATLKANNKSAKELEILVPRIKEAAELVQCFVLFGT